MNRFVRILSPVHIALASFALSQTACSSEIFKDLLKIEDEKSKGSNESIVTETASFNSSNLPNLYEVMDLTLFQLAKRTLQMTKMVIKNDEFNVDEYRYYSVQTAFEDLVHELREDTNQYWTVKQHLNDLELSQAEFFIAPTSDENETAWSIAEELLDLRINQVGSIAKNRKESLNPKDSEAKTPEPAADSGENQVGCETPGKDKDLWKYKIPEEGEINKCVSHVHHLWGSVKRDSTPLVRDNACLDFAFAIRIFEKQRNSINQNLGALETHKGDEYFEEGRQLRAEQAAATYGLIQSAKMYAALLCVGNGAKPGEY